MTVLDPAPAPTVDAVIERVGRASDMHEFERAWTEGLRFFRSPDDRDRILAEAGRRLRAFGDMADDCLRRNWLSQVVEEVRTRGEDSLGDGLSSVAVAEMREAFAHARAELAELRASVAAGEGMADYAARSPLAAEWIRDLGRMAQRLRGSGLMALVSGEDAGLARDLAAAMVPRDPLVATVPEMWRVSRDDLLGWPQAERELPRLVRSLIAETVPSAEGIDMPAGAAVSQSGWDGAMRCSKGNRFVPDGLSVFELSAKRTGSDGKARRDYDKRVRQEAPGGERADTAYVAVICAPWTTARDFEREKSLSNDFRLVRALNVDSLETWLECAPLTTVWLREQMGEPVAGVGLLSAWWAKWLDSTTMPLDAPVVLAGRDEHAETLRDRCHRRRGGVITIGGNVHRDEILAFASAALVASDASGSLADALFVDDRASCQRLLAAEALSSSGRPSSHALAMTVVVPSAHFADCLPAGSQHRLIVPVPGSSQADIVLEAADSEAVASLVQSVDKDTNTAYELGALARMSLLALRRRLAVNPELHRPSWAGSHIDSTMRRSLLLNSWNETSEGDRRVVERFVGYSYGEATEALRRLDPGDAPMILTDEQWHVVSPADAWTLLSDHITRDDVEMLGEVTHDVLTESDPFYGMSGSERMLAQYEGVDATYSRQLRHGVATTLALLGSGPPQPRGASAPFANSADGIVSRILRVANNDPSPKAWAAVARELPLLAEAAPAEVLRGLRTCISGSHAFMTAMFADSSDEGSVFPPGSPHLHVIDALEVLAWFPDHLYGAVDVLASLAVADPGGAWSNRPNSSLASIMCPWMPHTSAGADARLKAVGMLRERHGPVAWELMLSMLPGSRNAQMDVRGPLYHEWKRKHLVAGDEYWSVVDSVGQMLVEDAGRDPDRWATLVERVGDLPLSARRALVGALSEIAASSPAEAFRSTVWPELRQTADRHREFGDTDWALPESELKLFDPLLERLQPARPAIAHGWLFSSNLMMVDGKRWADDHEAHGVALAARRARSVEELLAAGGIDAVRELAETVEMPYEVGIALATQGSALDADMLEALHGASEPVAVAALTFFESRFGQCGWELIDRLIADHAPPKQVVADLLRAIPAVDAPWRRADALGADVADEYWTRVNPLELGTPSSLAQFREVSQRLRKTGRARAAIRLICMWEHRHESSPDVAEEAAVCLEDWLQQQDLEHAVPVSRHEMSRLMKMLDRHREHLGTGRVATLEWQYLPSLAYAGDTSSPNLHRHLAQDPDLFVSLVEIAYRPASWSPGDGPEPDETTRQRALNAHRLLHSWPSAVFSPGGDGQQGVNAERLDGWVDHARSGLEETDRQGIGYTLIGAALAASPADSDGEWPGAAVRDLIERVKRDDLDRGLTIAVCNQRGGTTRSPTDGGDQERELADRYREQSRRFSQWPRTAAIFDNLATTYEHEAGIQDRSAEARRRGL